MHVSSSPVFQGPTFLRLLARLTDTALPHSGPAPAERLSQWIDWTRAVALSKALDARPDTAAEASSTGTTPAAAASAARAKLEKAIAEAPELTPVDTATGPDAGTGADFAPFRQRCLSLQRAMQIASGRLRGDLREQLAASSPEAARLAEVDAVMEGVLSPREYALLGTVPALLETHFEHLRTAPPAADGWLAGFRRDMQGVLYAELDVRFQPVDALLAALRTH